MAATSYGLGTADYSARPDFNAKRDAKGAWTASNSFTMLREVWESYASGIFLKDTPITEVYPELPKYWGFLLLDEVDVRHETGAITIVGCSWRGTNDEEEEAVYTLSGTRVERSIMQHPLLLDDMQDIGRKGGAADTTKAWFKAVLEGKAQIDKDAPIKETEITFEETVDWGKPQYVEHNKRAIKWARMIFVDGHETFMAPTLQWTQELSSVTGWTDTDLDFLGLKQFSDNPRPPGYPPMPHNGHLYEWMLISMNQNTTGGLTTQSRTWELSPPKGFPKFPGNVPAAAGDDPGPRDTFEDGGGVGLYEYDADFIYFTKE